MILDRTRIVKQRNQRYGERKRRREDWHRWFAWHPVEIGINSGLWVWLQFVDRKLTPYTTTYTGIFGGETTDYCTRREYSLLQKS